VRYLARMSPGKKRAEKKPSAAPAADIAPRREWSATKFRKRLRQLRDSAKSTRAFATEIGESERLLRAWLNPNEKKKKKQWAEPGSEKLHQIGQQTGVSIDWLLGFEDVPMMRKDRAMIGQLARALVEYVARKCPSAAVLGGYVNDLHRAARRDDGSVNYIDLRFAEPPPDSVRIDLGSPAPDVPNELVIEPGAQHQFLEDVVRWALGRRRVMDATTSLDAASEWPQEDAGPDWVHDNKHRARAYAVRAGNVATKNVDSATVRLIDMETGAHVDWPGHASPLRAPAKGIR